MFSFGISARSVAVVAASVFFFFTSPLGAQDSCRLIAVEDWDDGTAAGWVGTAGTTVTAEIVGGNPGGYLSADNPGLVGAQTSEPFWIGNWSAADFSWIRFEFIYETADLLMPHVRVRESGATNGWYFFVESIGVNDGFWHSYEVPVDPLWTDQQALDAGWSDGGMPNVSFAQTLGNVGIVQLSASALGGAQTLGMDNFTLLPCLFADGFESVGRRR